MSTSCHLAWGKFVAPQCEWGRMSETKLASKKDPILKCIGWAWLGYASAASTKKQSSWWPRKLAGAWPGNPEAKKRQNLRAAGGNRPFAHIELELWNATCCNNLNSPWTFGSACGVADTHIHVSLCMSLNEFPLWILYLSSFCFDQMLSTKISWRNFVNYIFLCVTDATVLAGLPSLMQFLKTYITEAL